MKTPYLSELLAAGISVAIMYAYHYFLRMRVRRDPGYTLQAVLRQGRTAWVERMMAESQGILAVQTLRNSIMGASFFASTAVALIVGTITLSTQCDRLNVAWQTLSPIGAMMVFLVAAFVWTAAAIWTFLYMIVLPLVDPVLAGLAAGATTIAYRFIVSDGTSRIPIVDTGGVPSFRRRQEGHFRVGSAGHTTP